jgi:hypothetical protein
MTNKVHFQRGFASSSLGYVTETSRCYGAACAVYKIITINEPRLRNEMS